MEALLTTFIASCLAEFGDKTQLLVVALAARYNHARGVILGVAIAAIVNGFLAGAAGTLISHLITLRAISLLIALALVFAAVAGLIRQTDESEMGASWRTGAFVTSLTCFFLLEFADKTQFLTFAFAAQYDSMTLAAIGAPAGVLAANAPAAMLGARLPQLMPLAKIRIGVAIFFLLAGFLVAINALRLI